MSPERFDCSSSAWLLYVDDRFPDDGGLYKSEHAALNTEQYLMGIMHRDHDDRADEDKDGLVVVVVIMMANGPGGGCGNNND